MKRYAENMLAALGSVLVVGCTTAPSLQRPREQALAETHWQLVSVDYGNGQRKALTPQQRTRHVMTFNDDGKMSLTLDCNRGFADWSAGPIEAGNGALSIGPVASTRALCPAPSFGEELAADLPSARGYTLLPGGKGLTIVTDRAAFVFVSTDFAATGEDALVPGTDYHATAQVPCGMHGAEPDSRCFAGVKRNWGEDGTILVEVTKPDGSRRALFFNGTTPYGADSAQADGSAGWNFSVARRGDESVIRFGPESYVIVDAFVTGG
ncbi:META domain-containing protein [Novosphingobium malaysiense]|uniref:META domain-containing protein n=1 Tax=Novosphingobium malaysiense TaxID=1348853 RepID=UPI00068BC232|nr:META domain-containing protein [Novosphingobium malaysiense]